MIPIGLSSGIVNIFFKHCCQHFCQHVCQHVCQHMFWQGINAERHKVTQKKLMTLQSLAFHRIMKEVQPELVSKQLVVILTKVKSFQSHHQIVCVYREL